MNHPAAGSKKGAFLKENSIAVLTVARIAEFGAFLSAETGNSDDDILLHRDQQTAPVKEGDQVKVFLYHDPHHRLTASMRLPQIELGHIGYVKVLLTTHFGAFVDVGTERGIFLPFSEMIGTVCPDQSIWVKLYQDKTGRLAVTMHVDEEIRGMAVPSYGIKVGGKVTGTVYNMTDEGAFIITREKWIAFLYRKEYLAPVIMGQEITGRVTYIRDDGHINISLRPQKENAIEGDAELLMAYIERHGGVVSLTDQSDPETIKHTLGISKAAFKRAVGNLLKKGMIEITPSDIRKKSIKNGVQ